MSTNQKKRTRREVLKKAGVTSAFVIPTVVTFNVAEAQTRVSRQPGPQLYDPESKPDETNCCRDEEPN